MSQFKNNGIEKEMKMRTMGTRRKKLCVTEKKRKDNGCRSQLQLPPCKPFRPTDVQANDCHSANLRQLDAFVHNSSKTSVSV